MANHPPLHYLAVAPLIWFAEATDRPDGGLLLMRFANLAFAAAGVVFTYLLATELSGGMRRVGLAAAAIVALVPQGHTYFSRGLNDGLAFAAGTGLIWAGVRCLRRVDRRNLIVLGAMAAVAAGTRTATMLLAVVVVGAVVLDRLTRPAGDAWRTRLRCGGDHRGDRSRSGRRPVRVVLRPHPRCSMATSEHRRSCSSTSIGCRAAASATCSRRGGCGPTSTTGSTDTYPLSWWAWPRFANLSAVVAIVGLIVGSDQAPAGNEPAGHRRLPPRRGGHHADGRSTPRRRRQSVPAVLLPRARRSRRAWPPSASSVWCRACYLPWSSRRWRGGRSS